MLLLALAEGVKGAAAAAGDEDSNSKTGLCRLRMLNATATGDDTTNKSGDRNHCKAQGNSDD